MESVQATKQAPAEKQLLRPVQTVSQPVTISTAPQTQIVQTKPHSVQSMSQPITMISATPQTQTLPHSVNSMSQPIAIIRATPETQTAQTMQTVPSQLLPHNSQTVDIDAQTPKSAEIFEHQEQHMFYTSTAEDGELNNSQWIITDEGHLILNTASPRREITVEELVATQKLFGKRQQRLENLLEHVSNKLDQMYEFMLRGTGAALSKGTLNTTAQAPSADEDGMFAFNLIDTLADIEKFEENLKETSFENELVSSLWSSIRNILSSIRKLMSIHYFSVFTSKDGQV